MRTESETMWETCHRKNVQESLINEVVEIIRRYRLDTPLFKNEVDAMIYDIKELKNKDFE